MNSTSQVRVLKWLIREGRYSTPLVIVSVCVLSYVQVCNPVDCIAGQSPLKIPWDFPGKKMSGLPFPIREIQIETTTHLSD